MRSVWAVLGIVALAGCVPEEPTRPEPALIKNRPPGLNLVSRKGVSNPNLRRPSTFINAVRMGGKAKTFGDLRVAADHLDVFDEDAPEFAASGRVFVQLGETTIRCERVVMEDGEMTCSGWPVVSTSEKMFVASSLGTEMYVADGTVTVVGPVHQESGRLLE